MSRTYVSFHFCFWCQLYYYINETIDVMGTHLLEVFVNGEQIENSPLLLSVIELDCERVYGRDSLRVNDANGECICSNLSFPASNGKCQPIPVCTGWTTLRGVECVESELFRLRTILLSSLLPAFGVLGEYTCFPANTRA